MGARKTKAVEIEKKPVKRPAFTPAFVGGIFVSLVAIVAGAVFIGKSDNGQINVNATIQSSNQANIDAGGDVANNVALVREDLRNMPNGGLIPQENQPAPEAPPADVGTTTGESATSTPESGSASSTKEKKTEGGTPARDSENQQKRTP